MAPAVIYKSPVSLALHSAGFVLPAVIADASLYALTQVSHVPFNEYYIGLAEVVAVLCLLLFRPAPSNAGEFLAVWTERSVNVAVRWAMVITALLAIGYVSKTSATYSRMVLLMWAVLTPMLLVSTNFLLHLLTARMLADPANSRRIIFAGLNEVSKLLAERIGRKSLGMSVVGCFDDRSVDRVGAEKALVMPLLGRLPDMAAYVKNHQVDAVIVALPIRHVKRVVALIDDLRDTTASIYYAPDIFVFDLVQTRTLEIDGIPVIAMCETPFSGYRGLIKRVVDIGCCVTLIPVVLPLMLVVAAMVRLSSSGPIIFKQRRYGLNGNQITVFKFRTMFANEDGGPISQVTRNDPRVTPIGRFLRRYSLDELPQLVNVLQGRMSLVGPRPHAVAHNEQYRKLIKGYMVRHKVLPGITGLAQVNGCRGETAELEQMQERVNYDLEYLRRWTPLLDLKILMATVLQLVYGDGKAY